MLLVQRSSILLPSPLSLSLEGLLRIWQNPLHGLMCMQAAKKAGIKAYTWQAFLDMGRKAPSPPHPPKPDDLCTIMYTSGTTGDPKVLQFLQRQLISLQMITCALRGSMCTQGEVRWSLHGRSLQQHACSAALQKLC